MFTEEDILTVINEYKEKGIVTRKECANINSRPLSNEIYNEMQTRGYKEAMMTEEHLEGWTDYSRAIYNSDRMNYKEANEYLKRNVLCK